MRGRRHGLAGYLHRRKDEKTRFCNSALPQNSLAYAGSVTPGGFVDGGDERALTPLRKKKTNAPRLDKHPCFGTTEKSTYCDTP
jgi:hypothetical protein